MANSLLKHLKGAFVTIHFTSNQLYLSSNIIENYDHVSNGFALAVICRECRHTNVYSSPKSVAKVPPVVVTPNREAMVTPLKPPPALRTAHPPDRHEVAAG